MFISRDERWVISPPGWRSEAERSKGLWRLELPQREFKPLPLTGKLVSAYQGDGEYFTTGAVVADGKFRIDVRHFNDPSKSLAFAEFTSREGIAGGEINLWSRVKRHYTWTFLPRERAPYHLLIVSHSGASAIVQQLTWFNELNYDMGYQGVQDASGVPGTELVLLEIGRASPHLYDPVQQTVVRTLDEPSRFAGSVSGYTNNGTHVLTSAYDTLVVVDCANWNVIASAKIQDAGTTVVGGNTVTMDQFIGDVFITRSEVSCWVARPFSKDVVEVGLPDLAVRRSLPVGGEPLEIVTTTSEVITRDWKSGAIHFTPIPR
jgi:hypothetical protein